MKIKATEKGIFLEINPESMLSLGTYGIEVIVKAATFTVAEPGDTPTSPPIYTDVALWKMSEGKLRIPKGILKRLPAEWEWDVTSGNGGENIPITLTPIKRFPIELEPLQLDMLKELKEKNDSGIIEAAMGAGKSWLLLSLILGNPLLRPAAISGKGEKDTKQLLEKLIKLNQDHPEYAEPVILSGLGRSLGKRDKKILDAGEGIVICTHAGLQNLPENTKLLVLDEVHAAATPKRVNKMLELSQLTKAYGLTGTSGLRGDGGDELLSGLLGGTLIKKGHEHFEETGRVAPAQINAYHFTGKGIYAENPYIPDQTPQEGYSTHATWVENHRGRHEFIADLVLSLPHDESKLIFVPHILHAIRICKAIEKKIHDRLGDLSYEERENYKPLIFHAKADKNDKYYMSKEERERRVALLEKGLVKVAVSTDFLSTGFDTNMIDHIIDASGQKAIIGNIQRSGRGIRPRTKNDGTQKINQIHTILDKTHPVLHKLGEKRFAALCAYYNHKEGVTNPNRLGGAKRFLDAPWINPAERAEKLKSGEGNKEFIPSHLHTRTESTFDPKAFFKKKS